MAHILVVGGTGMLREVSLFLARHDNTVSVVGLEEAALSQLKLQSQEYSGRIHPIRADYRDTQPFMAAIKSAMDAHGPITLAIAWMYMDALPDAANALVETISAHSPVCRYFQVLPSSGITGKDRRFLENPFPNHSKILYRKIILGFNLEEGMSRWLTSEEISTGVIKAVRDDKREAIVGSVAGAEGIAKSA